MGRRVNNEYITALCEAIGTAPMGAPLKSLMALLKEADPEGVEFASLADVAVIRKDDAIFRAIVDEGFANTDDQLRLLLVCAGQCWHKPILGAMQTHPRVHAMAKQDAQGLLLCDMIAASNKGLEEPITLMLKLPFPPSALTHALAAVLAKSFDESGHCGYHKSWRVLLEAGADPNAAIGRKAARKIGCASTISIAQALAHSPTHHFPDGLNHLIGLSKSSKFRSVLETGNAIHSFAGAWMANGGDRAGLKKSFEALEQAWWEGDAFHVLSSAMVEALGEESSGYMLKPFLAGAKKNTPGRLISDKDAMLILADVFRAQVDSIRYQLDPKYSTFTAFNAPETKPKQATWSKPLWTEKFSSLSSLFETPQLWEQGCQEAAKMIEPMLKKAPSPEKSGAMIDALLLTLSTPTPIVRARRAQRL